MLPWHAALSYRQNCIRCNVTHALLGVNESECFGTFWNLENGKLAAAGRPFSTGVHFGTRHLRVRLGGHLVFSSAAPAGLAP